MTDIKKALSNAITRLKPSSDTAQTDAEILLAHTLNKSRSFLYSHPETTLNPTEYTSFEASVEQRVKGQPIAYLIGYREFWSLKLHITKDTLIPRPETELLVTLALDLLKNEKSINILDLGTGSGAIALSIAKERPNWQVYAADVSQSALDVAKHNLSTLALSNVQLCQSDWFSSLPRQQFHAIVSNPPYIANHDPHLIQGDLRFEPSLALVSGKEGLDAIHHLIKTSYNQLLPGGLLLLEHGFEQKNAIKTLLSEYGYKQLQCWQDMQGHDRVSGGWRLE